MAEGSSRRAQFKGAISAIGLTLSKHQRRATWALGFALSLAWVASLWLVRGEPGLVWDEPPLLERHLAMSDWLQSAGRDAGDHPLFSDEALDRGWPFCLEAPNEHPPMQAILSWCTGKGIGWLIGPLRSVRLATVFGFAATSATVLVLAWSRWGAVGGLAGFAFCLFQPRYLGDSQLATFDGLASAMFFLAATAFVRSCETGRRVLQFAALAGIAAMTKATCVLLLPMLAAWALACRIRSAWKPLLAGALIGPVVAVAIHPGWWTRPVRGPMRWIRAVVDYRQWVPTHYLGETYDQRTRKTPWHKPFVTWAATTPGGWLALLSAGMAVGLVAGLRRRENDGVMRPGPAVGDVAGAEIGDGKIVAWALIGALTAPVAQAAGILPAHDGMRQLASSFPFQAVLAAAAAGALARSLTRFGFATRLLASAAAMALVVWSGSATWRTQPNCLDYYGEAVGGAPGAQRLGFETTYYWDAVGDETLDWLNANVPEGARIILFPPPDVRCFGWNQRWGKLRQDIEILQFEDAFVLRRLALMFEDRPCFLLFLMREGKFVPIDRRKPAIFEWIARNPARYELVPPSLGVRLVAIYDQGDFRRLWPEIDRRLRAAPPDHDEKEMR